MRQRVIVTSLVLSCLGFAGVVAGDAHADDIEWQPCGDSAPGAECATVEVPRDWDDPTADTIELAMTRRVATDPDNRKGVLFFNPGGPGTGAAGYVGGYAEQTFSPALREQFDLIGIDPRGVGGSDQVHCDVPVYDPDIGQFPRDEPEFDAMVTHNAEVAESCDGLISEIDTISVARDLDAVRRALGESQVTFFGKSYGSMLGTAYAQLFPERVRAMALDAVMDHGMSAEDMVTEAAAAVEASFNAFVDWCAATGECALNGRDVGKVWDELLARAEIQPIPAPDDRAVTAEELRSAAYAMLNMQPEIGPQLAAAIDEASGGDAGAFASIRAEAQADPGRTAAYRSILCLDIDPQLNEYEEFHLRAERVAEMAPHMGGTSEFWDMTAGCLGWPIAPTNPQQPVDIPQAPPILLVGNTVDPATPLRWAHRLSTGITDSRVLTVESDGHTAYFRSNCATEHIDAYLTNGELPAHGTVCHD